MPIAPVRNAYLHYAVDGPMRAPAIVLSNSLGTDYHLWDAIIARLASHFRVIRYDTRGHGGSTGKLEDYTIDELGQDVVDLLNFLNIDRAHICGISLGGMTAMWLAIHAPERVNRIVPCNTAARLGTVEGWNSRIETVRAGGMASIADGTMERWFSDGYRTKHKMQVATTRQMFVQTYAPGYMSCCAALRDADLTARVASIIAPTLVVAGSCDPVTPPSDLMWLQANIPGAKYLELKASHLSNVEQPDAFLAAMLEFFGERGESDPS